MKPLLESNFSAARTRPIVPSWIRSRNGRPWLRYRFAIETTSRRFASTIACFAPWSFSSIRFASSTSCAAVSNGTLPMSLRKSCSVSVEISGFPSSHDRCSSAWLLGLPPARHLDSLVQRVVERVELCCIEIELVERKRHLVGVEPSLRPACLEQGSPLLGLEHAIRSAALPPGSPALERSGPPLPSRGVKP